MTRRRDGLDIDVAVIQQHLDVIRASKDEHVFVILVLQHGKFACLPRFLDLLEDGLETGLGTGFARNLLDFLSFLKGLDLLKLAQRNGFLRGELVLENSRDFFPVALLQARVAQVSDDGELQIL